MNARTSLLAIALSLGAASPFLAGCTSDGNPATDGRLSPGHARCPVCVAEGDLACVDVRIETDTPRAEFGGRTYWFCSDTCRAEFLRDPARYVRR